jgi:hypothetical protein
MNLTKEELLNLPIGTNLINVNKHYILLGHNEFERLKLMAVHDHKLYDDVSPNLPFQLA